MVETGATSAWETYIMYDEGGHPLDYSMNHYSPGAVCAYLFNAVCGINVAGENYFVIKPVTGGTLKNAKASYNSPYGKVESAWNKIDGHVEYVISIPANCTAEIVLPDGIRLVMVNGDSPYDSDWKV